MTSHFYSIRMRASQNKANNSEQKHISGGERICDYTELRSTADQLLEKAMTHSRGRPDFIQIKLDLIEQTIQSLPPLPIKTNKALSVIEGRQLAKDLLISQGITEAAIEKALTIIQLLPALRGAIIVDRYSGERLDSSGQRGIRVSRMDWKQPNFNDWSIDHFVPANTRLKEALTLTTKVCRHHHTVAELCWSDDPDYQTGYVASMKLGYQRINNMKELGKEDGCRIIFVDCETNLSSYINYLEKEPIFIQWSDLK